MLSASSMRGVEVACTSRRCDTSAAALATTDLRSLGCVSGSVSRSVGFRQLGVAQLLRSPPSAGFESPVASSSGRKLSRPGRSSEGLRTERSMRPLHRSTGLLIPGAADVQLSPPRSPRPFPVSVASSMSTKTEHTRTQTDHCDAEATVDESEADFVFALGDARFRNQQVPVPSARKQRQRPHPSRRTNTAADIRSPRSRTPRSRGNGPVRSSAIELWSSGAGSLRNHESHSPSAGRRLWGDLKEVFVILFGSGEEGNEGIYSLRALSREDGLPKDTIIAFQDQADAERYAAQLAGTFRTFTHLPNVCSIPPEELLDFCVEAGYNCRLEPCGTRLMPPNFNVGTTDWERSLRLRSGEFSVLEQEPGLANDESGEIVEFGLSELDRMKLQLERLMHEDFPQE